MTDFSPVNTSGDAQFAVLGKNTADNAVTTAAVTADADGSILERLEWVQAALGSIGQVRWQQSDAGTLDEDGGHYSFDVGVVDQDTGAVASANINIASAVVSLSKSTGGGAFSTAGITQPTVAKADGLVTVSADVVASEWTTGDHYKITLTTVTATDSASNTSHMPSMVWTGLISEVTDLKTSVGETSDAAVDPQGSTGSLHAKMRGVVDYTWDEVLTGATHNVASSAGRRLRQIASDIIHDGTAQTGSATSITLDNGASSTDNIYDPSLVLIDGGTGVGQVRRIVEYNGTTKVATVDKAWRTNPDATSTFLLFADPGGLSTNEGLAAAGAATSITLNAQASSVDDTYNGQLVHIRAGTGEDQVRLIVDYNGTTKVATVSPAWDTNPTSASVYVILPAPFLAPTADATGSETIAETIGNKADVGSTASTASTHALIRALTDTYASATGTADSGSSSTLLVDAALTQASADYWKGMLLVMTSGANDGLSRIVVDFDPATDTATVNPAFPSAISAGDTYAMLSTYMLADFQVALNGTGVDVATNSLADQLYLGAGEQLRNFIAKTGGTALAASKSLVDALGTDGTTVTDAAVSVLGAIGADNNNNAFASTNVAANRDGSVLERQEHLLANVGVWGAVQSGTFSMANNTSEQDVTSFAATTTKPAEVIGFLDLVNAAQTKTIRVYVKVDGTNYRSINPKISWTTADEDGIIVEFKTLHDWKVTLQSGTGEAISVPWRYNQKVSE